MVNNDCLSGYVHFFSHEEGKPLQLLAQTLKIFMLHTRCLMNCSRVLSWVISSRCLLKFRWDLFMFLLEGNKFTDTRRKTCCGRQISYLILCFTSKRALNKPIAGQIRNRKSGVSGDSKASEQGETLTSADDAAVDEAKKELEEFVGLIRTIVFMVVEFMESNASFAPSY